MTVTLCGAYWTSSIRIGKVCICRNRAGSVLASRRSSRSSRVTYSRSSSASRRSTVVFSTCLGPVMSRQAYSFETAMILRLISRLM